VKDPIDTIYVDNPSDWLEPLADDDGLLVSFWGPSTSHLKQRKNTKAAKESKRESRRPR
jgi:hypothetical protein